MGGVNWIDVIAVLTIIAFSYQLVHMTKQSEYMEAFFGVELNHKFEDMITELKDVEEGLKELQG